MRLLNRPFYHVSLIDKLFIPELSRYPDELSQAPKPPNLQILIFASFWWTSFFGAELSQIAAELSQYPNARSSGLDHRLVVALTIKTPALKGELRAGVSIILFAFLLFSLLCLFSELSLFEICSGSVSRLKFRSITAIYLHLKGEHL